MDRQVEPRRLTSSTAVTVDGLYYEFRDFSVDERERLAGVVSSLSRAPADSFPLTRLCFDGLVDRSAASVFELAVAGIWFSGLFAERSELRTAIHYSRKLVDHYDSERVPRRRKSLSKEQNELVETVVSRACLEWSQLISHRPATAEVSLAASLTRERALEAVRSVRGEEPTRRVRLSALAA